MRDLTVSFGTVSPAVITSARRIDWPTFADWLTAEPKEVADKADLGWYCPCEFDPVYRDSQNFVARHAITFDFDRVSIDTWGNVINAWETLSFAMYTTFSHTHDAPRFRVVMPLARPAGYDEFQAVARKLAADIGIELFARESFTPAQMMYSPARKLGGFFISHLNTGEWLDVDAVLSEYTDWTDRSSWPHHKGDSPHTAGEGHIDHCAKPGIVGAFNKAFPISVAIAKFDLPYRRVR